MSLSGWDANKKLKLTIASSDIDSALTDFPVLVNLGTSVGKGSYDASAVFDELAADSYTKLLISSDDADGSTTFTDSSVSGHTIITGGNAHHETDQSKFGDSAIYFSAATDDLTITQSTDFDFGTGDFTIDFWVYFNSGNAVYRTLYDHNYTTGLLIQASNALSPILNAYINGSIRVTSVAVTAATWTHCALVREGTDLFWIVGGTKGTPVTYSADISPSAPLGFGQRISNNSYPLLGYLDEIRISKGIARWTADFTPPTVPYVNRKKIAVEVGDTGVQCYCEIERWDDANETAQLWVKVSSVSASADTVLNLYYDSTQSNNTTYVGDTGDTSAQSVWNSNFVAVYHMAQDPSDTAPQILDSTSNDLDATSAGSMTSGDLIDGAIGKAIEFDGTDDYASIPDDASWDFGTGDFTVSGVFNLADITSGVLFALESYATGMMAYFSSGTFYLWVANGNTNRTLGLSVDTTFTLDVKRVSGTVHVFVDGVEIGTGTSLAGTITTAAGWRVAYGFDGGANTCLEGIIENFSISDTARSDDWIAATHLSSTDALITFSLPGAGASDRIISSFANIPKPYNTSFMPGFVPAGLIRQTRKGFSKAF